MRQFVRIDDQVFDLDYQRDAAQRALLDAGEQETRIYTDAECSPEFATISVLRDSGTVHQVTGR